MLKAGTLLIPPSSPQAQMREKVKRLSKRLGIEEDPNDEESKDGKDEESKSKKGNNFNEIPLFINGKVLPDPVVEYVDTHSDQE